MSFVLLSSLIGHVLLPADNAQHRRPPASNGSGIYDYVRKYFIFPRSNGRGGVTLSNRLYKEKV